MHKLKLIACLLALLAFCACVCPADVARAEEIDPAQQCALTVCLPSGEAAALRDKEFTIDLYRFASIDKDALLALLPSYEGVTEDINAIKATGGAAYNEALLKELPALLLDKISQNSLKPTASITKSVGEDSARAEPLEQGLYLVVPEQTVITSGAVYEMAPFVVSLPNGAHDQSPYWQYDLTATLKPGSPVLTGSVRIKKSMLSCNTSLGGADVYFRVEGVLPQYDEAGNKTGELPVYNNVLALHFDAPGEKFLDIPDLPIGTVITVTEVQTGAAYALTSTTAATQRVTVTEGETASVSFENEYDQGLSYSTSIVNSFDYTGKGHYNHSKLPALPQP